MSCYEGCFPQTLPKRLKSLYFQMYVVIKIGDYKYHIVLQYVIIL